jgi:hypothetical protein
MKVTTKQTHKAWVVYVNGTEKYSGLTMHQAEAIAHELRLEIKRGIYA